MKTRLLTLAVVCAAGLCGQSKKFSWQDACFKNPAAPFCKGNDFAVKPPAAAKKAASTPRPATPALIVAGSIDWRFADPLADELAGFNFTALSASPLAHNLIAQLGAKHGLTEADVEKIFDGLAGIDQVALSVRNKRVVVMINGRVTDAPLPAPQAALKVVAVSGSTMLVGHPDAVDQAMARIGTKGPSTDLMRLAEEFHSSSDFWVVGSARSVGPIAVSAGLKRFLLTVALRERVVSDLAFEFNGAPNAGTVGTWPTMLGAGTVDGNALHVRTSMETDEVRRKFGQIVDSPLGERLATLIEAARYLPVGDTGPKKGN